MHTSGRLLDVGDQYRRAIESYWRSSPGTVRSLPTRLEDLVNDMRFPQPRRHLRKLYPDPVQPEVPWALVKRGNQIIGVSSQSDAAPLRRTGFPPGLEAFTGVGQYSGWRFLFIPRAAIGAAPAPALTPAVKP